MTEVNRRRMPAVNTFLSTDGTCGRFKESCPQPCAFCNRGRNRRANTYRPVFLADREDSALCVSTCAAKTRSTYADNDLPSSFANRARLSRKFFSALMLMRAPRAGSVLILSRLTMIVLFSRSNCPTSDP
jgi:hypothetical protein